VERVGSKDPVKWTRGEAGLEVDLSSARPGDHALALRITRR
jgi:hypothetical protein